MNILLILAFLVFNINFIKTHSISEYKEQLNYLKSFGYIENEKSQNLLSDDKINDEKFTRALKEFQVRKLFKIK